MRGVVVENEAGIGFWDVEHVKLPGDFLGDGGLASADVAIDDDDSRILIHSVGRRVKELPEPVQRAILVIPWMNPVRARFAEDLHRPWPMSRVDISGNDEGGSRDSRHRGDGVGADDAEEADQPFPPSSHGTARQADHRSGQGHRSFQTCLILFENLNKLKLLNYKLPPC